MGWCKAPLGLASACAVPAIDVLDCSLRMAATPYRTGVCSLHRIGQTPRGRAYHVRRRHPPVLLGCRAEVMRAAAKHRQAVQAANEPDLSWLSELPSPPKNPPKGKA